MKEKLLRTIIICFFFVQLVVTNQVNALSPLSDYPLFLGGNISPNVMFTLDDSGSMHWEIMPDDSIYSYYLFPRASRVYGASDYSNYVPTFVDGFVYSARVRSSQINPIYYNPAVTYQPWSNSDGSLMPNAVPTAAYHNPANIGSSVKSGLIKDTLILIRKYYIKQTNELYSD
ncbi:MAG: hypothetical protein H0V39_02185 [Nitrosomonas sp.]|nr:hypothetical protein [Nitrosomonas sp.]